MSDWPRGMDVAPIREWPGTLTAPAARRTSPFSAGLSGTLLLLDRELQALGAKRPELLVAIAPEQFRLDGRPRASAQAAHPGVVLSFVTKVGHLAYPCDRFTTWQDNLRAVALALEALRKIDRYGVTTHGEQYRGFLAIEAQPQRNTRREAIALLFRLAPDAGPGITDAELIRAAKRATHPDTGGNVDQWQAVLNAERILTGRAA